LILRTERRRALNRSGQGLVEYILVTALVCVGLMLALALFRDQIGNGVDNARTNLEAVSGTSHYVPGGGSMSTAGSGSGGSNGQGGGSNGNNGRGGGRGSGNGNGNGNAAAGSNGGGAN